MCISSLSGHINTLSQLTPASCGGMYRPEGLPSRKVHKNTILSIVVLEGKIHSAKEVQGYDCLLQNSSAI